MQTQLYGHPESGHTYKVKLALHVAGIAHRYEVIDIGLPHAERPEPFRSLARFGEVPVLVHQGQVMLQSNAILCWLAEHTGRFGGESASRMSRVHQWLFWEANRLGLCLPHLRFARKFAFAAYPAGSLQWLEQRWHLDIAQLALALQDGRLYILDDQASVADFSLCGYLFWADQAQLSVPPNVAAWLTRISHLPGWAEPYAMLAAV